MEITIKFESIAECLQSLREDIVNAIIAQLGDTQNVQNIQKLKPTPHGKSPRICKDCGKDISGRGKTAKRCEICAITRKQEQTKILSKKWYVNKKKQKRHEPQGSPGENTSSSSKDRLATNHVKKFVCSGCGRAIRGEYRIHDHKPYHATCKPPQFRDPLADPYLGVTPL